MEELQLGRMPVQPIRDRKTIDDISQILKKRNIKYFIMWKLGLNTGLRIGDVVKLQVGDIREKDGSIKERITIRTKKTQRVDEYLVTKSLKRILKDYLKDKEDNEVLIPTESNNNKVYNKAISRQYAWKVINEAARQCGVKERIGTHTMRKSFGYWLYQKTKDIVVVQKALKHSGGRRNMTPQHTMIYIGITSEMIDKDLNELDL